MTFAPNIKILLPPTKIRIIQETISVQDNSMDVEPPSQATNAVLVASETVPENAKPVTGIDWTSLPPEHRTVIADFVNNLTGQGFQSSSIGDAIRIINDMVGGTLLDHDGEI
jgi:hypothetical protein